MEVAGGKEREPAQPRLYIHPIACQLPCRVLGMVLTGEPAASAVPTVKINPMR